MPEYHLRRSDASRQSSLLVLLYSSCLLLSFSRTVAGAAAAVVAQIDSKTIDTGNLYTTSVRGERGERGDVIKFIDSDADTKTKGSLHSSQLSSGQIIPELNEFSHHAVIRPQLHHGRHKRELRNTFDEKDGLHIPQITLTYHHDGQEILIDLRRNDDLLPDKHFLRYQNSSTPSGYTIQNYTKTEDPLCHYQGSIRGKPESYAAISTCNGSDEGDGGSGISGIVYDGLDTYFIHSRRDGRSQEDHFLLRHSDMINKNATTCGYNKATDDVFAWGKEPLARAVGEDEASSLHIDGMPRFTRNIRRKRSYDDGDNNAIRGPYNANKYSSYVELVIVVDNKVYKSFGENVKRVHQHCKDLTNIINALYVPLNIFVALVGVVIWTDSNEIDFSSDGDVTLRNFLNYRRTKLVLDHPNDNAQLLTKEQFNGGVVGKALKGPICTHEYSGGVSMEHNQIIAVVATTMAHEMGHNFGMEHDTPDCKCQDEKCIMSASSTSVTPVHWSSCSIDQLNIAFSRGMNYCLRNKPTQLLDSPQCGNGFVEPGEQCDCGLPNYCENTCCDPNTCMLRANASCATGECCDLSTCLPKVAGTTCRGAENECDLAEFCTGESEYCPSNVYRRDTEKCDRGRAYCYQGNCRSHSNQCRVLWGPTGENSEHCYTKNIEGKRTGNCGYNRLNNTFIPCDAENAVCGMLHCRHLNERLEFGMESAAVLSHSFMNHRGSIVPCRTALVDLGLDSIDPGLTPNGAKCGVDKMCVNQQCLKVAEVLARGVGKECPDNCGGHGVCNSRGHCHCDIGYAGETCGIPGPGGSVDSGPATNPNSHQAFERFMYIFFFGVIPCFVALCCIWHNRSRYPFLFKNKLTENIMKSAEAMKKPSRPNNGGPPPGGPGMPKSTPSSTDDMNSALLKSTSDSSDVTLGNGIKFGKYNGFTLRPLNDAATPGNNLTGSNVAYVQPTVLDNSAMNGGVPQRSAPPLPMGKMTDGQKMANGTLPRKAPPPPSAPALPPPNPGSSARPIISMPVLETSTLNMPMKTVTGGDLSPTRDAPAVPAHAVPLKPAPPPPVPLHADPKLNMRRDGTIRRLASFLKKEEKPPVKEKMYMDREKLRNLEISAPMPVGAAPAVAQQSESSNSDSETATLKEQETKNLVKRTQSMRSPTRKTNVQTFGSMRQAPGMVRPQSVVSSASSSRPKSPPPRPPPLLKKTNSTTSSGYQLPVATAKSVAENSYDDCEFVELPLTSVGEDGEQGVRSSSDNIYSVIDEIPPASETFKRSELVNPRHSAASDLGLLGEIVNEIEKRNGESLYSASTMAKAKLDSIAKGETEVKATKAANGNEASTTSSTAMGAKIDTTTAKKSSTATTNASTYLRPAPVNTPVARVAPTRSDLTPTSAFSSFKPPPAGRANKTMAASTTQQQSRYNSGVSTNGPTTSVGRAKTSSKTPSSVGSSSGKSLAGSSGGATPKTAATSAPSATIQKPKPLSAKPSFNNQKKPPGFIPTGTPRTAPVIKSGNIASLTQRFEKTGGASTAAVPAASTASSTAAQGTTSK